MCFPRILWTSYRYWPTLSATYDVIRKPLTGRIQPLIHYRWRIFPHVTLRLDNVMLSVRRPHMSFDNCVCMKPHRSWHLYKYADETYTYQIGKLNQDFMKCCCYRSHSSCMWYVSGHAALVYLNQPPSYWYLRVTASVLYREAFWQRFEKWRKSITTSECRDSWVADSRCQAWERCVNGATRPKWKIKSQYRVYSCYFNAFVDSRKYSDYSWKRMIYFSEI